MLGRNWEMQCFFFFVDTRRQFENMEPTLHLIDLSDFSSFGWISNLKEETGGTGGKTKTLIP